MEGGEGTKARSRLGANRNPDLLDEMGSLCERTDLERLFDRKVEMSQILRLAGRGIGRRKILALLESPDPAGALRKLLDS